MKATGIANLILNLAVVAGLGFLVLKPGGALRTAIEGRRTETRTQKAVRAMWSDLVTQGHRLDSAGSRVVLVEFSDYECVYCQEQHKRLARLLALQPEVGVAYLHLPLDVHAAARGAARAAICADALGFFPRMHAQLFADATWRTDTNWTRVAWEAGFRDSVAFARCLGAPTTAERLGRDSALARALGIYATPTFVHRQGIHVGMLSDSALRTLVSRD